MPGSIDDVRFIWAVGSGLPCGAYGRAPVWGRWRLVARWSSGQSGPWYGRVLGPWYWSAPDRHADAVASCANPDRGHPRPSVMRSARTDAKRCAPCLVAALAPGRRCLHVRQTGWTYAPAPSATPLPSVLSGGSAGASAQPLPRRRPRRPSRRRPQRPRRRPAVALERCSRSPAQNIAFDTDPGSVPANTPFQIQFPNKDAGRPAQRRDQGRATGRRSSRARSSRASTTKTYDVPALDGGQYTFVCTSTRT